MSQITYVFDPTTKDKLSRVRGIGRYLELLKENFLQWRYISNLSDLKNDTELKDSVFINPFFNFLKPPLTMKRIAQKQIAVIHDLIPLKYPKHFPAGIMGNINICLNKLALKNYHSIVTDSQTSKKDIIQMLGIDDSRVKVIYPCLPKAFVNSEFKIQNSELDSKLLNLDSKFCLYVGDVTWNKNLVNLAHAIKIADISCVFVGKMFEISSESHSKLSTQNSKFNNPWLKEFNEFNQLTKGDKRFIFLGFIPDYKLVKLYQQARLNILLSRDEGFGFSYLEAAQFSCPSLLSAVPVLKEISNQKGSAFAEPDNPKNIADVLKKVFFDDSLQKKLASEAQQQAKVFSSEEFKKNWLTYVK